MAQNRVEEKQNGDRPHPVDEVLPIGKLLTYGFQHVLAMYAGAVGSPLSWQAPSGFRRRSSST